MFISDECVHYITYGDEGDRVEWKKEEAYENKCMK